MFDSKKIVLNALLSGLDELSFAYNKLASMEASERESYVFDINERYGRIESDIKSERIRSAIIVLIKYQYATRFSFYIHPFDECGRQENESQRHFIDNAGHRGGGYTNPLSDMCYEMPTEIEFIERVLKELEGQDFYCKVNVATYQLFGISLPSESDTFDDWLRRSGLLERDWSWRYSDNISRWRKRWIKPKKKILAEENRWKTNKESCDKCIEYVRKIFSDVKKSYSLLSSLKKEELEMSLIYLNINRANEALRNGTTLKCLLLEEAVESESLYRKISHGL